MDLLTLRERGMALHRSGRLAEAERLYADVLREDPSDYAVLHLLGIIAHATGRHERAVELIGHAIALRGGTIGPYLSLGNALMALGRAREALAAYDAALALQPDYPIALSSSAVALRELHRPQEALARAEAAIARQPSAAAYCVQGAARGDLGSLAEAVTSFDAAIALDPKCVEAHHSRGIVLQQLQRSEEARAAFESALALRPRSAELWSNLGNVLRRMQRLPEALASCETALALRPDLGLAHNNRGLVLQALRRYEEAAASYERALALQPDLIEACANLGAAQCELGRPELALESCRRALELRPGALGVRANLGNALRDLGRPAQALAEFELALREEPHSAVNHCNHGTALFDLQRLPEAIASYDQAIALEPAFAQAYFNKSVAWLLAGDFARGLPLYESRKRVKDARAPPTPAPQWDGAQPLAGRALLLYADQALGDTIQFCRYAKLAEQQGAQVTLGVQPQLTELIATLSPAIRVIGLMEAPAECELQCALGSLPLAFGSTLHTLPANVPYLSADPRRVADWRQRLGSEGFKVGIVWQGSRNRIDVGRSVPLGLFAALAGVPGVRLISLQKGKGAEQLRRASPALRVEQLPEPWDDGAQAFLDSAAIMMHLDLLITSDTALAHLAGALGVPAWVALKYVPDWRWLLERSDNPWYPSLRLFRQPRPGDWPATFADIHRELGKLCTSFNS